MVGASSSANKPYSVRAMMAKRATPSASTSRSALALETDETRDERRCVGSSLRSARLREYLPAGARRIDRNGGKPCASVLKRTEEPLVTARVERPASCGRPSWNASRIVRTAAASIPAAQRTWIRFASDLASVGLGIRTSSTPSFIAAWTSPAVHRTAAARVGRSDPVAAPYGNTGRLSPHFRFVSHP